MTGVKTEGIPPPKLRINRSVSDSFSGFADNGKNTRVFELLAGRYIMSVSELNILAGLLFRGVICLIICVEKCRTTGNLANQYYSKYNFGTQ